jgi:hypothetical protein
MSWFMVLIDILLLLGEEWLGVDIGGNVALKIRECTFVTVPMCSKMELNSNARKI